MSVKNREINVQPKILDLLLYGGDGISFRLLCATADGTPVDISGSVSAQVRFDRVTETDPIVEFDVIMTDAYLGIIRLSLTGDETQELIDHPLSVQGKFVGVWDIEWIPADSQPRTLCQGKVECVADVTR